MEARLVFFLTLFLVRSTFHLNIYLIGIVGDWAIVQILKLSIFIQAQIVEKLHYKG